MMERFVICLLSLMLHVSLVVSDNKSMDSTINNDTIIQATTDIQELGTNVYSTVSATDLTEQTLPLTSLLFPGISTKTPLVQKSTERTLTSTDNTLNNQKELTVVTKPTAPIVTKTPSKTKRKKKRGILLIVLVILCGMFFIFACVVPYLKRKIKLSKLRHHLVPVYSFEAGEGEDWETELLTEHRDKEGQQPTDGATTRANIVREVPQLRLASDSSCTV